MGRCVTWSWWQVICWPWWWQVHAQGAGQGIQLHVRVGCTGVWIWWASALPPIVGFIASPPTSMMKSQAAVVWRGQTRQPNSPGKRQNGCRPHSSTTILCCVWWETAVLRHEGEGSIKGHQIFICHKAPSPLALSPQSRETNHQEDCSWKQQQDREEPAETEETALIIFDLTPGNTDLFIDEHRQKQEQFTHHLIHRLQESLITNTFTW